MGAITWMMERMKEPSTMAGLSALAVAVGMGEEEAQVVGQAVAAVLAVMAVVMKEKM